MLSPIALGQRTIQVPGLIADPGGVAVGPRAFARLPTLGHLVAVLRGLSRALPLKRALGNPTLANARVERGGRAALIVFEARGAQALDRIAGLVRLHQGQLYVGEGRRGVRFRDAGAPLGYDSDADPGTIPDGEVHLHDRPRDLRLTHLEPVRFDRLVRSLSLTLKDTPDLSPEIYLRAPDAMMRRLARLLLAREVRVEVTRIAPVGGRGGAPEALLRCRNLADGLRPMLMGLPGVTVYRREHDRIFVESHRAHPLDLPRCADLLEGEGWLFFSGAGGQVDEIERAPRFTDAGDLRLPRLVKPAEHAHEPSTLPAEQTPWPIRLVRRPGTHGAVEARLLSGPRELTWLVRIAYRMTDAQLRGYRVVLWEDHALVAGDEGLPEIPVGQPLRRLSDRVLCPADHVIRPHVEHHRVTEALRLAVRQEALLMPTWGVRFGSWAWRTMHQRVLADADLTTIVVTQTQRDEDAEPTVQPLEDDVFSLLRGWVG
jgi:hypothetical protein